MPTNSYSGGTMAIAQVTTVTPIDTLVGKEYTLRVILDDGDYREISYITEESQGDDLVAGLVAAWNAQVDPPFAQITAEDMTSYIKLTSDYAGIPFTLEADSESGGGTLVVETTTPNSGPNDVAIPENWSLGRVPIAGDDIRVPFGAPALLYNLWSLNVAPTSFIQEEGHTAGIGREGFPVGGYAPRVALKVNPTATLELRGGGTLVVIDCGTAAIAPLIVHTGVPAANRVAAVYLRGTNMTSLEVRQGYVLVESGTVSGNVLASGTSTVTIGRDVVVDSGTVFHVVSSEAELISYVYEEDVVVHRQGTFRQQEGTWGGTLTMYEGSKVYANAEGGYGDVVGWGGDFYTDQTATAKTFNSITVNSITFARHDLVGMVTVSNPLVVNVEEAGTEAV